MKQKLRLNLQSVDSLLRLQKLEINGVNLLCAKFEDIDMNTLKETADTLRDKVGKWCSSTFKCS